MNLLAIAALIAAAYFFAMGIRDWREANTLRGPTVHVVRNRAIQKFFLSAVSVSLICACRIVDRAMEARRREKLRQSFHDAICRTCGYDIRATPEQCPECGAVYKRYL